MTSLTYSADSPSGLFRGIKVAGYKHRSGYWVVRHRGVKYYAHRLVWLLLVGPIEEGFEIDHIDGNKENNSIDNLRKVTHTVNMRNLPMPASNSSGETCVFKRTVKGFDYWIARWRENGKTKERHFSCNKYGEDVAKSLASELRKDMLCVPSEGYTDRHGRKE